MRLCSRRKRLRTPLAKKSGKRCRWADWARPTKSHRPCSSWLRTTAATRRAPIFPSTAGSLTSSTSKEHSMSRLQGKVALVTGASKGIGAGIAKGLAAAGASVAVNYASDRSSAEAVVAAITAAGGRAIVVPGDVSKSVDVARLFVETKAAYGALDMLVNNAAVYKLGPLEATTEEEFHREFNTNVVGPLLVIQ